MYFFFFQNIFLTRCCLAVLFFTIFAHTTYNVNKSVVYSNFLEAIQSFVRQYNILFLCWLKKYIYFFRLSQSFDLNIYPMFNRSTNVSTILIKFTLSTLFILLFYAFVSLLETQV